MSSFSPGQGDTTVLCVRAHTLSAPQANALQLGQIPGTTHWSVVCTQPALQRLCTTGSEQVSVLDRVPPYSPGRPQPHALRLPPPHEGVPPQPALKHYLCDRTLAPLKCGDVDLQRKDRGEGELSRKGEKGQWVEPKQGHPGVVPSTPGSKSETIGYNLQQAHLGTWRK